MARLALGLDDASIDDKVPQEAAALSRVFLDSLRHAFDNFRLDPGDPFSWRVLLTHYAFAEFGERPRKKPARPMMYTPGALKELLSERRRIINEERKPKMSDMQVAKVLANDKRSPFYKRGIYFSDGVEGLRKVIGKARRFERELINASG